MHPRLQAGFHLQEAEKNRREGIGRGSRIIADRRKDKGSDLTSESEFSHTPRARKLPGGPLII